MLENIDNFYSIKDVAKKLHVSRTFLYDEIKAGNIKATKFQALRISESEIKKYIEAHTV